MKVRNPTQIIENENGRNDVSITCPYCDYQIDNSHVAQDWPGLPAGVKFDPSEQQLLGHLAAKLGIGNARPHAFINDFIKTVEEDDGICYTHPENLEGVKKKTEATLIFFTEQPRLIQLALVSVERLRRLTRLTNFVGTRQEIQERYMKMENR